MEKARFQIQIVYSIESTQIPIQSENHRANKSSQNHRVSQTLLRPRAETYDFYNLRVLTSVSD